MNFIRFGYGVFAFAFSRAALVGLRLFFVYIIANGLDKPIFASLALGLTAIEIIRYLVDWGSDTYSMRLFSSESKCESSATFKWMITRQRPISSVAGALIAFFTLLVLCSNLGILNVALISMLTVSSLWYTTFTNWLQVNEQLIAFYKLAFCICLVAMIALVVSVKYGLLFTLLILLASETSLIALAAFKCRSTYSLDSHLKQTFTPKKIKAFMLESTPVAISTMVGLTYGRFDQFYLSTNQHTHELANYSLALRLADPVVFASSAIAIILYTRVSRMTVTHENRINLKSQINLFVYGGALFSLVMSLFYMLACVLLAKHIYVTFELLKQVSFIMSGLLFIKCINIILTAIIQGHGFFKEIMYLTAFNLMMTLILLPLGYSRYQLSGLILAIVVIETINCGIQLYIIKHKMRVST